MACGATLKRSLEFDPLHSPSTRSPKRRRCMPMTLSPAAPPTKQHQVNPSPFGDVSPKYTNEQIAANIAMEIKRMHRRRQLQYPLTGSPPPEGSSSPPPDLNMLSQTGRPTSSSPTSSAFFNALTPGKKEAPLFTFRQVSLVCERMLRERDEQIREEYDKVLVSKMAEQYEAFLKFNHDQLHRRFGESAASYVS